MAIVIAGLIALRTIACTQTRSKTLVDAALLFVVWKHGFVRADPAHVGTKAKSFQAAWRVEGPDPKDLGVSSYTGLLFRP